MTRVLIDAVKVLAAGLLALIGLFGRRALALLKSFGRRLSRRAWSGLLIAALTLDLSNVNIVAVTALKGAGEWAGAAWQTVKVPLAGWWTVSGAGAGAGAGPGALAQQPASGPARVTLAALDEAGWLAEVNSRLMLAMGQGAPQGVATVQRLEQELSRRVSAPPDGPAPAAGAAASLLAYAQVAGALHVLKDADAARRLLARRAAAPDGAARQQRFEPVLQLYEAALAEPGSQRVLIDAVVRQAAVQRGVGALPFVAPDGQLSTLDRALEAVQEQAQGRAALRDLALQRRRLLLIDESGDPDGRRLLPVRARVCDAAEWRPELVGLTRARAPRPWEGVQLVFRDESHRQALARHLGRMVAGSRPVLVSLLTAGADLPRHVKRAFEDPRVAIVVRFGREGPSPPAAADLLLGQEAGAPTPGARHG